MALRTQMGEKGNTAETQMALAVLQVEQGHAADADSALRQARDEFRKEGLGDDEILADSLLARIVLSQGRVADAEKATSTAHDLVGEEPGLFGSAAGVDCWCAGTGRRGENRRRTSDFAGNGHKRSEARIRRICAGGSTGAR